MSANRTSIKVVRTIQTSSEMVFEALAYECRLREWMCDGARSVPRKGGLFNVWWNSGYEARGVFTSYSPTRALAFTWVSPYEPGETSVRVALKPVESGTQVTLTHSGFGTGKKWAGRAEESEREWNGGLDNLKSTLETGVDLRQARLPRFGLRWEPAPDEAGALVTIVMERGPADLAGLHRGDVIVSFAGRKVRNEEDLMAAFRSCRAGQRVPIIYLREGKRRTTTVELDTRPASEIPNDPVVLVEQAHKAHEQAIAALRASVMILTDEQAGMSLAEGEWSVKQTLAHLSASERGFQSWAVDVLLGNETHWIEARLPEQFAAVFASAPTVGALLDRFERDMAETRAMVATLTGEHRANKARYRRIAQMLLDFAFHTEDHLRQIQATFHAIQGK
jgi:uncharacterized protein YndB with AHSA1/START domain